ncbi:MAG TPA: cytochrome c-type biogenesis protein CcmH [Gemmatimonadales bacterium]|nr:cytochrome c-type biogenesis protein CcmH [Gemmatimonadales bacterium]
MSDRLGRREFFTLVAGAVGAVIQDTTRAGRVYDPQRAGRAQSPITAADNNAAIQAIEKKLRCSCGCGLDIYTCRTTDFQCTYSPALHKDVLRLAGQGKTAQQILDEFVKQYGQVALMSPPRKGLNLAGYFLPGFAIIIAGFFLVRTLRRWTREAPAAATAAPPPNASPDELERLRRELDRLPG